MMNYEVKTQTMKDGRIIQNVTFVPADLHSTHREFISARVVDTGEMHVIAALEALGWRRGGSPASLDVSNASSPLNPLGMGTHFVTVDDVIKMEKQIRLIADALHL